MKIEIIEIPAEKVFDKSTLEENRKELEEYEEIQQIIKSGIKRKVDEKKYKEIIEFPSAIYCMNYDEDKEKCALEEECENCKDFDCVYTL